MTMAAKTHLRRSSFFHHDTRGAAYNIQKFVHLDVFKPSFRMRSKSVGAFIIVGALAGFVGLMFGVLIGHLPSTARPCSPSHRAWDRPPETGVDPTVAQLLSEAIDTANIERNLRRLSAKPHMAGEPQDEELVSFLRDEWTKHGLDTVSVSPYEVLLSRPDPRRRNSVQLLDSSGAVVFDSVDGESDVSSGHATPFLAFSPAGEVTGDLVYVNYGRASDYDYLVSKKGVNLTGKIVIARYGHGYRGQKVKRAALHGAVGVVLYSDPRDVSWPQEDSRVFPDTIWLPPTGVQRGNIQYQSGDVLTPGYPATSTAYRYPEKDPHVHLPEIPAQPTSYGAARHFLRALGGRKAPKSWQGGLNFTYRIGPLTEGHKVRLSVHNSNSIRRIHNVIGIIRGAVEPDRYVLLGNHRDAWVYGAVDPSGGTAVMMEVARVMASLVTQGRWRPRRSILFCSWGAEEYGLLGSTEWAEQYTKTLGARAIAYLNIDSAFQGNYSFEARGNPLTYQTLFTAAKNVPNPDVREEAAGRRTIYDTWMKRIPWKGYGVPLIRALSGSSSDYAPFVQSIGITSMDFRFTFNKNKYKIDTYPLYHTKYEDFDTVKRLMDPNFVFHQAVGRMGAEMLRSLSDSLIIPFNVSDYAWALEFNRLQLDRHYGALIGQHVDNYTNLQNVIREFNKDVENFERTVAHLNKNDPLAVRRVNDQLLLLEKAFIDNRGLPDKAQKQHLLWANTGEESYPASGFPGLASLMVGIQDLPETQRRKRWDRVRHHFSVIVNAIQAAGFTLRDVSRFVEEKYYFDFE